MDIGATRTASRSNTSNPTGCSVGRLRERSSTRKNRAVSPAGFANICAASKSESIQATVAPPESLLQCAKKTPREYEVFWFVDQVVCLTFDLESDADAEILVAVANACAAVVFQFLTTVAI